MRINVFEYEGDKASGEFVVEEKAIVGRVLDIVDTIAFEGDFVGDFLKRIFINQLIHT